MNALSDPSLSEEEINVSLTASGQFNSSFEFEPILIQTIFNKLLASFLKHNDNTFQLNKKLSISNIGRFNARLENDKLRLEGPLGLTYLIRKSLKWIGILQVSFTIDLFRNSQLIDPKLHLNKATWKGKPRIEGLKQKFSVSGISELALSLFKSSIEKRINAEIGSKLSKPILISAINQHASDFVRDWGDSIPELKLLINEPSLKLITNDLSASIDFSTQLELFNEKVGQLVQQNTIQEESNNLSEFQVNVMIPWAILCNLTTEIAYIFRKDLSILNSTVQPYDVQFKHGHMVVFLEFSGRLKGKMELLMLPQVSKEKLKLDLIDFKWVSKSSLQRAIINISKGQITKYIRQIIDQNIMNLPEFLNQNLPEYIDYIQESWGIEMCFYFNQILFREVTINNTGMSLDMQIQTKSSGQINDLQVFSEKLSNMVEAFISERKN